jgi:hypothetical protein
MNIGGNIVKKDLSGKSFENLTKIIFDSLSIDRNFIKVEQNIWLDGPDGKRQIDILMTADLGAVKVKTVIECRYYGKTLVLPDFAG